jgi:proteasome lid subunit RPN8/RPN11
MNFSIAKIMRRLLAPQHELSCSWLLWMRLLRDLRSRGHGRRESGAFLLGIREAESRCRVVDYLLYDDVDPHALDTGIVRLDGRHFGKLWDLCKARGVVVVADVHTHPGGSGQSASDQAHPIIARAGHLALIVPSFAAAPVKRLQVGMYRYLGAGSWHTVATDQRRQFFHIGL